MGNTWGQTSWIRLNIVENWKMYFYFLFFLLLIGVKEICSIQCYYCETKANAEGHTPHDAIEGQCEKKECASMNTKWDVCVKVMKDGATKVDRGCGGPGGEVACNAFTSVYNGQCWWCNTDLCNSAPYHFPTCLQWIAALSSIAVASVMRFYWEVSSRIKVTTRKDRQRGGSSLRGKIVREGDRHYEETTSLRGKFVREGDRHYEETTSLRGKFVRAREGDRQGGGSSERGIVTTRKLRHYEES